MTQFHTIRLPLTAALAAAALLSAAFCMPARAETVTQQVVVDYSDLNLNAKAGVDALRRRLVMASRSVCGDSARELSETADEVACRNEALTDALHDLRNAVASAESRSTVALAAK